MGDRAINSIPVKDFRSDTDNFDTWVELLEEAVKISYRGATPEDLLEAKKTWLKLKLDDKARATYANVTKTNWDEIKTEFRELLIDPQEKYNWQTRRTHIKWDGKETFHELATRIKESVDKFDPDCRKEEEYFFRFRYALPPDYRKFIDIGCGKTRKMEEAKQVAYSVQTALSDTVEDDPRAIMAIM